MVFFVDHDGQALAAVDEDGAPCGPGGVLPAHEVALYEHLLLGFCEIGVLLIEAVLHLRQSCHNGAHLVHEVHPLAL